MAFPKKKGLRSITVAGRRFVWKGPGRILVMSAIRSDGRQLHLDYGYYDWAYYLNDPWNLPPDFEPQIVTPAFVAKAIAFALNAGWNPDERGPAFEVRYSKQDGFTSL